MSVFRILLDELPPAGAVIAVPSEQAHHLRHVRRVAVGADIECLDRQGNYAMARVITLAPEVQVQVISVCAQRTGPVCTLTLMPALLPEDRFDLLLQKCTELGVAECMPLVTSFGVVKPAADPARKLARWQRICDDAARQCGGAPMRVQAPRAFRDALAHTAPLRLVADCNGEDLRTQCAAAPAVVAIMIGPEGGFSADELAGAAAAGWHAVRLHRNILRAETAAIVAAALLLARGVGS
jgi:16S rRNA (uracil1498-N3)-methyltransferase